MHDEDSASNHGRTDRLAGVECACVHGDRPAACCWLSSEDDPGGFPGVVYDRAAVAHGRTHTVAHACAAASWTLSLFSEYVVDAQFLDPRITGAAPSKQMHAVRAEQMPDRRSPDLRTDRTASASLADDGPDKRRVPFYLSARQSVFVKYPCTVQCKKVVPRVSDQVTKNATKNLLRIQMLS